MRKQWAIVGFILFVQADLLFAQAPARLDGPEFPSAQTDRYVIPQYHQVSLVVGGGLAGPTGSPAPASWQERLVSVATPAGSGDRQDPAPEKTANGASAPPRPMLQPARPAENLLTFSAEASNGNVGQDSPPKVPGGATQDAVPKITGGGLGPIVPMPSASLQPTQPSISMLQDPVSNPHPTTDGTRAMGITKDASSCWVNVEFLVWWVKAANVPTPLVTSLPDSGGFVDPRLLFGEHDVDFGSLPGGRLTAGTWLDCHQVFGLEGTLFSLSKQTVHNTFSSDPTGSPALFVPFINNDTGLGDVVDISIPGQALGRIDIAMSSELTGVEVNLDFNLCRTDRFVFDLLGGYRYLGLREELQLTTLTAPLPGQEVLFGGVGFPAPALTSTLDRFVARTDFNGAQLGTRAQWLRGPFSIDVIGKLAIGDSTTNVSTFGSSSLQLGSSLAHATLPGGLFAQPSNGGTRETNQFAAVPEIEVKAGWQLGYHVTVFASYDFLYWSRVARASEQINPGLTPGQIPTSAEYGQPGLQPIQPQPLHAFSDFWVQGMGFGIELKF